MRTLSFVKLKPDGLGPGSCRERKRETSKVVTSFLIFLFSGFFWLWLFLLFHLEIISSFLMSPVCVICVICVTYVIPPKPPGLCDPWKPQPISRTLTASSCGWPKKAWGTGKKKKVANRIFQISNPQILIIATPFPRAPFYGSTVRE